MAQPRLPITVALLASRLVTAATLFGFYDALASVRRDWGLIHGSEAATSPFRPLVVSRDGQPFDNENGVRITPQARFADCPAPDVLCVTDLLLAPGSALPAEFAADIEWIRGAYARGAIIASACSGAVVLAATGLLDGLEGTSHWAYCDALARRHPRTRWHPDRALVTVGEGQRIVMSGSGAAWHMLVLALIARLASPEEAMQVARINLLDVNETNPLAYASLTHGGRAQDPLIARCQLWAASNYRVESPVAQLVELSGLPERTFKRRFTQATGMSPLEYVHKLRLEEAKQMLEAGDAPIEAIAQEVGYQDASFFGRLFRRQVAMTPAQYRRRFGRLSRELRGAAATPAAPLARREHRTLGIN